MILQDDHWFDILPSHRRTTRAEGKWLHFGPTATLHSWLDRLDALVETDRLLAAKIARKLPGIDPFPDKPCVMCIYTASDAASKSSAKQILNEALKIDVTVWKSDAQTAEDWQPDGWLRLEAELSTLHQALRRGELDENARRRLAKLVETLRNALQNVHEPSRVQELKIKRTLELADMIEGALPGWSGQVFSPGT
jgi:hypothetical protein